jgi:hypothetical protein
MWRDSEHRANVASGHADPVRHRRSIPGFKPAHMRCIRSWDTGNWKLAAGNWKLEAGNRKLETPMCRNIKPLFNFEPPATDDEVRASALQFVRKVSGFTKPSKANEEAFNRAVDEVTAAARTLIRSLVTTAPPKDREEYAAKARERAAERYGQH